MATKKEAVKKAPAAAAPKKPGAAPSRQASFQSPPEALETARPPERPAQPRRADTLESQGSSSGTTSRRTRSIEEIAQRAYELWQKRGGHHGSDQDDWLRAERELGGGENDSTH